MKLFKRMNKSPGLPPGTLMVPEEKGARKTEITLFRYNKSETTEKEVEDFYDKELTDIEPVCWLNINGIGDVETFQELGEKFDIHELSLEDILNLEQRPKFEDHENYLFIVLKMISFNREKNDVESEQVSFILTEKAALTFQERPGDVFDLIRERIRKGKGRIRKKDADYLVYALIDAVIDNYFVVMEQLGERIENLENEVIINPTPDTSAEIHSLRRKVILLRRTIWPLREVVNGFMRSESELINEETKIFLRDLYDHTIQVIDTMETFRDMLSGLLDLYLSSASNKMNEIMKVLTIISTLFIPLGFLAGIYGMNFKYMPELEWRWAYPALISVMVIMVSGFLFYFRKRRWI